jgi:long-chain acyl-CoA synthetase
MNSMTMLDTLLRKKSDQNAPAVIYQKKLISYGELDRLATQFAAMLYSIDAKDKIAIFSHNCLEMVISYFAIFKLGLAAVPINTRFKSPELAYVLKNCKVSHIIVDEKLMPIFAEIQTDFPGLQVVKLTEASSNISSIRLLPLIKIHEHDLACILYTSGTTSKPKGVMHTHHSLMHTMINQVNTLELKESDKILISLSMCHIAGFAGQMLSTLYAGGCIVILDQYHPQTILNMIDQYHITHLMLLPAQVKELVTICQVEKNNLKNVKCCLAGGDKIPIELHQQYHQLTNKYIIECCGMTESFSYAIHYPINTEKLGSIGKPVYDTELKLVNDHQEIMDNQVGEILVKSQANAIGYWENVIESQHLLQNGWLYTGDLAYQDEDGYYWFMGRKKDIIIRGGSNISPLEVEEVFYKHPAIREVGVLGYPDKDLGQIVYTFVAIKEAEAVTENDLREFAKKYLADYKVPERIFIVTELPHNALGKLDRHKLLDLL